VGLTAGQLAFVAGLPCKPAGRVAVLRPMLSHPCCRRASTTLLVWRFGDASTVITILTSALCSSFMITDGWVGFWCLRPAHWLLHGCFLHLLCSVSCAVRLDALCAGEPPPVCDQWLPVVWTMCLCWVWEVEWWLRCYLLPVCLMLLLQLLSLHSPLW